MCGIGGFWSGRFGGAEASAVLERMGRRIIHRGPDGAGTWLEETLGVGLVHRRLSIIDLSAAGRQPMRSPCGRFVIVYNGEIYNHVGIRRELESLGENFAGHCDTEVLLRAISRWGIVDAVARCVGMFAFAVWDGVERTLTLCRDRIGEKPLYYGYINGHFAFGSELTVLREMPGFALTVDRDAAYWMIRYGYVPGPLSIYENVRKLEPGAYVTIRSTGTGPAVPGGPVPYWRLPTPPPADRRLSDHEALARFEAELSRSVERQMVADVSVGAFLSGGIDSSLVVATMRKLATRPVQTFTVGFAESKYDEAPYARAIAAALGTEHHELPVSAAAALELIPQLPAIYDEPFGDSSQIPTILLARLARQSVKVALSGDGGDELFLGYPRYAQAAAWLSRLERWPSWTRRLAHAGLSELRRAVEDCRRRTLSRTRRFGELLRTPSREAVYGNFSTHFLGHDDLLGGGAHESAFPRATGGWGVPMPIGEWAAGTDMLSYMPDNNLVKLDRAAMSCGLETRVPLLDHAIVELAAAVPAVCKVRAGKGKWLMREALSRHLPPSLYDRPKMGFGIPLDVWLRGPFRPWVEAMLDGPRVVSTGLIEPLFLDQLWQDHVSRRKQNQFTLWPILMLEQWLRSQRP